MQLPDPYSRRIAEIGDVGYINDSGTFIFVFNLFLPSNDPLNQLFPNKLPEDYFPLDPPTDNEILKIPDYFAPGSVIASNGVNVTRVSESPLHLKFKSSEAEAVAVVLPDGASREDFKGISRLQEHLNTHAERWMQYLNNGRHSYSVPNGGLYVCASKSGIVSYEGTSYGGVDLQERCLFIRGIRIALSDLEWNVQIDEIDSDNTPVSQLPSTPPISDLVLPAKIDDEEPLQLEAEINNKEINHGIDSDSVNSDITQNNNVEVRNVFQNGPQLNL
uniref:Uncharacterized protein n=1 Tax=Psilocybe cubensis TaxID=181762 RepID=A0A8H7Y023_PSICU